MNFLLRSVLKFWSSNCNIFKLQYLGDPFWPAFTVIAKLHFVILVLSENVVEVFEWTIICVRLYWGAKLCPFGVLEYFDMSLWWPAALSYGCWLRYVLRVSRYVQLSCARVNIFATEFYYHLYSFDQEILGMRVIGKSSDLQRKDDICDEHFEGVRHHRQTIVLWFSCTVLGTWWGVSTVPIGANALEHKYTLI